MNFVVGIKEILKKNIILQKIMKQLEKDNVIVTKQYEEKINKEKQNKKGR